jgi:hypothetical protein
METDEIKLCKNGHLMTINNTYIRKNGYEECKECHRIYMRRYIKDHPKYRKRKLETQRNSPEISRKSVSKWKLKNRIKDEAHMKIRSAVKNGLIKRGVCEICGSTKTEGHHDDYNKPLEVRWLCKQHHKDEHRKIKLNKS